MNLGKINFFFSMICFSYSFLQIYTLNNRLTNGTYCLQVYLSYLLLLRDFLDFFLPFLVVVKWSALVVVWVGEYNDRNEDFAVLIKVVFETVDCKIVCLLEGTKTRQL